MTDDEKLMQQALEALNHVNVQDRVQIITALRERLGMGGQMNKEDIIKLAREAGYQHPDAVGTCEDFAYFDLERFAALVAAAEREACAKLLEDAAFTGRIISCTSAAKAIRARGNK